MKKIKLKNGEIVLVDDENYKKLNQYKWCLNSAGYATRRLNSHKSILMHREIMNTPDNLEVDHIDGNHENNSPTNLRTLCANCHRLKTWLTLSK